MARAEDGHPERRGAAGLSAEAWSGHQTMTKETNVIHAIAAVARLRDSRRAASIPQSLDGARQRPVLLAVPAISPKSRGAVARRTARESTSPCPFQKERTKDDTPGGRHEPRRAPYLQRRRGGGVAG